MNNTLRSIFLLCIIFWTALGQAANIPMLGKDFFHHYVTTSEGLSDIWTTNYVQDERGLVWIATKLGIDCYDGSTVRNYKLPIDEHIAYYERSVYLVDSPQSGIVAYTNSGLMFRYNRDKDQFSILRDTPIKDANYVHRINADDQGLFYICSSNGLYTFNETTGQLCHLIDGIDILAICRNKESLYVATQTDILCCNPATGHFTKIINNIKPKSLCLDEETNSLWVGTANCGIVLWSINDEKLINAPTLSALPHISCRSIVRYDSNTILAGFDGVGIYAINTPSLETSLFDTADADAGGLLKSNGIYSIMKDRDGNIWVGSYSGGVTLLCPGHSGVEIIRHDVRRDQSLIDNHVYAIMEDRSGNLWFGTDGGLSKRLRDGSWQHYLRGKVILTISEDNDGNIWTGGYGTELFIVNSSTGLVQNKLPVDSSFVSNRYVKYIESDSEGNMWVAVQRGNLICFKRDGSTKDYDIPFITDIQDIGHRQIAISTPEGIAIISSLTDIIDHRLEHSTDDESSLPFPVLCVCPGDNDKLLVGTEGSGLLIYNLSSKSYERILEKDGLASNYIYSIQKDLKGRIWIGTNKGLSLATLLPDGRYSLKNLGYGDMEGIRFLPNAYALTSDGRLAYGSTEGAVLIDPEQYNRTSRRAPLVFTGITLTGNHNDEDLQEELNKHIAAKEGITLAYSNNSFEIRFAAVNYHLQKDISFYYMLKGREDIWLPLNDNTVHFNSLTPKTYELYIKAVNRNSGELLDTLTLPVKIKQPYWNTWEAWVLYAMVITALFIFGWNIYLDYIRKQQAEEKMLFFVKTAHNARTPLSLVMAPLEDLNEKGHLIGKANEYLQMARRNAGALYNIMTNLMDFEKVSVYEESLFIEQNNLSELSRIIAGRFRSECERKCISLNIDAPNYPVMVWIDSEKISRVIENLISNAVKYSLKGGSIVITIKQDERYVTFGITDSGIGIPKRDQKRIFTPFFRAGNVTQTHQMGTGIGLVFSREVAMRHGGNLSFKSSEGVGSTFTLSLKRGNKHLSKFLENQHKKEIAKKADTLAMPIVAQENTDVNDNRLRMLIVEDSSEMREYLAEMFSEDYYVTSLSSGEEALAFLSKNGTDIILSDIMMSGIQGDELCQIVKSNFNISHIPVILLTAKANQQALLDGFECGADDYITKPFNPHILKIRVKAVLSNREKVKAHLQKTITGQEIEEDIQDELGNLSAMDRQFILRCRDIVIEHLSNTDFKIVDLCREMALSRTVFYEKLKSLIGETPQNFILMIRMRKAAELLREKRDIVSVSIEVGFTDSKYFSTVFKKIYGVPPSKYI